MKKLKRLLRERGIKVSHFAVEVLGIKYATFKYKCREESFSIQELRLMAAALGVRYGNIIDTTRIEKVKPRSKVTAD